MKLFKIGDVSRETGVSVKTLRYYEQIGLISPKEVDKFTGYRYYDTENVKQLQKVLYLKSLGLSLSEIKSFDEKTLDEKCLKIRAQIDQLHKKLQEISFMKLEKGEKSMKIFVDDPAAIGKWAYIGSSESKESAIKGDMFKEEQILLKELYFLADGEGYWIFHHWSKGEIFRYDGTKFDYEIEGDRLFLYVDEGEILVYAKVDGKKRSREDIARTDNIDLPFVKDESVLGLWKAICLVDADKLSEFTPHASNGPLFVNGLTFNPNGECHFERANGMILKMAYTKGFLLNQFEKTASKYFIRQIDGEDYMFLEWKSGDYIYGGVVRVYYVLKRVK